MSGYAKISSTSGAHRHGRRALFANALTEVAFTHEPQTSPRRISRHFNISQSTVHRVIRLNMLHLYHYQKVQELLPQDLLSCILRCYL